jgi:hypothetical protein
MKPSTEPKYPDVTVRLTGTDGNAFALIGRVRSALREAGVSNHEIQEFVFTATQQESYEQLLQFLIKTANVT